MKVFVMSLIFSNLCLSWDFLPSFRSVLSSSSLMTRSSLSIFHKLTASQCLHRSISRLSFSIWTCIDSVCWSITPNWSTSPKNLLAFLALQRLCWRLESGMVLLPVSFVSSYSSLAFYKAEASDAQGCRTLGWAGDIGAMWGCAEKLAAEGCSSSRSLSWMAETIFDIGFCFPLRCADSETICLSAPSLQFSHAVRTDRYILDSLSSSTAASRISNSGSFFPRHYQHS